MGIDKERVRSLFGQQGDVNHDLAEEYGTAYLDHPDDTRDDIPKGLKEMGYVRMNGILRRQREAAPEIDCEASQRIVIDYLKRYMAEGSIPMTAELTEQFAAVFKHESSCWNPKCYELEAISHMEKYLSPEKMRRSFGEEIENWEFGKSQ